MSKENKYARPIQPHVVHATEQERRNRYNGCVSRNVLRAILRKEAREDIDIKHRGRPGKAGETHGLRRSMAEAKGHRDYRAFRSLPEPK